MFIFLSLLISLVGLFMWHTVSSPKWSETGKIMFGVGLLVFLLHFGPDVFKVLRG